MLNNYDNQFIKNEDEIKEEENKTANDNDVSVQNSNDAGGSVESGSDVDTRDNVTTDEDLDRVLGSNQNADNSDTENNNGSSEVSGGDESGETLTPGQQEGSNNVNDEGQVDVDETIADESQQNKNNLEKEKMIAQSKVNDIAAKARQEGRDSAIKELLMKYGVNSSDELDDLFGKGQSYIDLDNEYNMQGESYRNALAENALLKSRIDLNRWEDVKLILGGKGLEITPENIEAHIVKHPEWRTMQTGGGDAMNGTGKVLTPEMGEQAAKGITVDNSNVVNKQPATLRKLGNEASPTDAKLSEEELAKKLYDLRWNK